MTLKTRNRYFLVSLISVFVMAVTILFSGGKISFSPLLVRGSSSEPINGSITWTKDSSKTKLPNQFSRKYAYYSKTGSGTGIYLYTYGYQTPTNDNIFDSTNSDSDYGIYVVSVMDDPESLFTFQRITAVTITTGVYTSTSSLNGIKFYPNGLSRESVTTDIRFAPSTTYRFTTEVANGTQLVIKPKSALEFDITSLTIEYTCTPGGVPTEKTLSSISLSGQTTAFTVGDTFSFGGTVTAHYSDSTTADVTSSSTFSGYDMSESGDQTVTVSYTEKGVTKTTTYSISVDEAASGEIIVGTYAYSSRVHTSYTDWTGKMTITFNSNGKGEWRNVRSASNNCAVFFDYVATNNGANITIEMECTDYDFNGESYPGGNAQTWSGSSADRPLDGGFAPGLVNNTGVMTLSKQSITISTYERAYVSGKYVYREYDTLTFTLAS